jgi:hypothetical protein
VNAIKVLHVAHVHIDPADIIHAAACLLDGGFDVLAHLSRLRFDIADTRDGAVRAPRRHAGNKNETATRGRRGCVRKMPARLA